MEELRRAARTDAIDGREILANYLDCTLRFLVFEERRQTFRDLVARTRSTCALS